MQDLITVAVVEDNEYLRQALFQLINASNGFKCVGAWANAENLNLRVRCTHPMVVLMDIELKSPINGIEATKLLKTEFPEITVVIQTVFEDDETVFQAIQAGASGYLLKKVPIEKLMESLAEAAKGHTPITPCIARKLLNWLPKTLPMTQHLSAVALTDRQKEVLEGIVAGKNSKTLAEELFISSDTVRFHIKKIYEVLQVHSKYELIMMLKK
jgi:DNA-binding NarL/FixJ family response regulator